MYHLQLSIIIPTYQQASSVVHITQVLRPILAYFHGQHMLEVLLIDDGSTDNTAAWLQAAFAACPQVRVIRHTEHQGNGAVLRTGIAHAMGEYVITTTLDGAYSLATIPQILARLKVDHSDVVTASPYHPAGRVEGQSGITQTINRLLSWGYRQLTRSSVHTWSAPYRAYRRTILEKILPEHDDEIAYTEMLVKAAQAGLRISEFPTTLHCAEDINPWDMLHLQGQLLWQLVQARLFKTPARLAVHTG